uniref:Uncharacterized protein n=1 Tax=Arthrobacter rhombi TaxID=71253 RepID=G8DC58_9MICC|nr:hypothetical protein [Arthrobacter rhombi]AER68058.1 hypothetical protein [Arthrobacter rhombi]
MATSTAPTLGLAEAAAACGVSLSTLRRRRDDLRALGATDGPKGWSIPVPALIELGLMDRTTAPAGGHHETPLEPAMTPPVEPRADALAGELAALRQQVADAERRAAVAEAIAAERERIIEVQATALRMIEGARQGPSEPRTGGTPDAAPEAPPEAVTTPSTAPLLEPQMTPPAATVTTLGPHTPDTARGTPQGAPLWRRLMGRR